MLLLLSCGGWYRYHNCIYVFICTCSRCESLNCPREASDALAVHVPAVILWQKNDAKRKKRWQGGSETRRRWVSWHGEKNIIDRRGRDGKEGAAICVPWWPKKRREEEKRPFVLTWSWVDYTTDVQERIQKRKLWFKMLKIITNIHISCEKYQLTIFLTAAVQPKLINDSLCFLSAAYLDESTHFYQN